MTNILTIIGSHTHKSKRFLGFYRGCLAIAATATLSTGSLLVSNSVHAAGFQGDYDPSNWELFNEDADGFVDTTGAPGSITLTGGDNQSGDEGFTDFLTISRGNGIFKFTWNYSTEDDDGPFYDYFAVLIGDNPMSAIAIILTDDEGDFIQTGTFSQSVSVGQLIGFSIGTYDNLRGSASVTISDFSAPASPAIPTPAMLPGLIGMGIASWRKKRQQNASK